MTTDLTSDQHELYEIFDLAKWAPEVRSYAKRATEATDSRNSRDKIETRRLRAPPRPAGPGSVGRRCVQLTASMVAVVTPRPSGRPGRRRAGPPIASATTPPARRCRALGRRTGLTGPRRTRGLWWQAAGPARSRGRRQLVGAADARQHPQRKNGPERRGQAPGDDANACQQPNSSRGSSMRLPNTTRIPAADTNHREGRAVPSRPRVGRALTPNRTIRADMPNVAASMPRSCAGREWR